MNKEIGRIFLQRLGKFAPRPAYSFAFTVTSTLEPPPWPWGDGCRSPLSVSQMIALPAGKELVGEIHARRPDEKGRKILFSG